MSEVKPVTIDVDALLADLHAAEAATEVERRRFEAAKERSAQAHQRHDALVRLRDSIVKYQTGDPG